MGHQGKNGPFVWTLQAVQLCRVRSFDRILSSLHQKAPDVFYAKLLPSRSHSSNFLFKRSLNIDSTRSLWDFGTNEAKGIDSELAHSRTEVRAQGRRREPAWSFLRAQNCILVRSSPKVCMARGLYPTKHLGAVTSSEFRGKRRTPRKIYFSPSFYGGAVEQRTVTAPNIRRGYL